MVWVAGKSWRQIYSVVSCVILRALFIMHQIAPLCKEGLQNKKHQGKVFNCHILAVRFWIDSPHLLVILVFKRQSSPSMHRIGSEDNQKTAGKVTSNWKLHNVWFWCWSLCCGCSTGKRREIRINVSRRKHWFWMANIKFFGPSFQKSHELTSSFYSKRLIRD